MSPNPEVNTSPSNTVELNARWLNDASPFGWSMNSVDADEVNSADVQLENSYGMRSGFVSCGSCGHVSCDEVSVALPLMSVEIASIESFPTSVALVIEPSSAKFSTSVVSVSYT